MGISKKMLKKFYRIGLGLLFLFIVVQTSWYIYLSLPKQIIKIVKFECSQYTNSPEIEVKEDIVLFSNQLNCNEKELISVIGEYKIRYPAGRQYIKITTKDFEEYIYRLGPGGGLPRIHAIKIVNNYLYYKLFEMDTIFGYAWFVKRCYRFDLITGTEQLLLFGCGDFPKDIQK